MKNRVLLINMPLNNINIPPMGVSLLKSCLEKVKIICDIYYANICFAKKVGLQAYNKILNNSMIISDLVFSEYFWDRNKVRGRYQGLDDDIMNLIKHCQSYVSEFIAECFSSISWSKYYIIGFSVLEGQTLASLSLARLIKKNYPDRMIIFGGSNCNNGRGEILLKLFPFIDIVFEGDSTIDFPEICTKYYTNEDYTQIPNFKHYQDTKNIKIVKGVVKNKVDILLDKLPFAKYNDWITQSQQLKRKCNELIIPIRTSKGCPWSKCIFCSDCNIEPRYLKRSIKRVQLEIKWIINNYHPDRIAFFDCVTNINLFNKLFSSASMKKKFPHLFGIFRANLKKEDLKRLKQVDRNGLQIDIGIESLSPEVLQLMKKGSSILQNIQILKWCTELNIQIYWAIIFGSINDSIDDYKKMVSIIEKIYHLFPPERIHPISIRKNSRLFEIISKNKLRKIEPENEYKYIYPFKKELIWKLANSFYLPDECEKNKIIGRIINQSVQIWYSIWEKGLGKSLLMKDFYFFLLIFDYRPNAKFHFYFLKKEYRIIYKFCDTKKNFPSIISMCDNHSINSKIELQIILDYFCINDLMLKINNEYLSIAISPNNAVQRIIYLFLFILNNKYIWHKKKHKI